MANIRKRGNKFQVQVRRVGSKSFTKTFARMTEARAWARAQEVNIDRNEAGFCKPLTIQLGDLLSRYLHEITPQKKSRDSEARRISRLLRDPISKTRLCDLSPDKLASFRDNRLTDGLRASSYDLQIIRHAINISRSEWGFLVKDNPVDFIRMPSQPKPRDRRLKEGEYEKLLYFSASTRSHFLRPLIIIAVETGMRLGELLNITWANYDPIGLTILVKETKNGRDRLIPLSSEVLGLIDGQPETDEKIFPVTYSAVKSAWQRLCNRAQIDGLRFHDLRHEATSRFFEMGLTVPEVASITGHQTPAMLLRYAHADFTALQKKLKLRYEESRRSSNKISS